MRRIFALGLLLLPTPALADTLTVEFTYEVFFVAPFDTQPGGSFDPTLVSLAAPFTPGKTFSASYSYDLGQADQNPDPLRGTYSLSSGQVDLPSAEFPTGPLARTEFTTGLPPQGGFPGAAPEVAMSLGFDGTGAGADATFTMTTFTLDQSLLGGFFGPPPPQPLITLGDGLPDQSFWESFGDVPFAPGLTIKDFLISNLVISLDQCDPLTTFCPLDRQAIVTSLVTDIDVTVASVTPVPLPATLPLSMLALGATGFALRKRKAC